MEKKDKLLEEKIKENEGLRRDLNETKQELTSHLNEVILKYVSKNYNLFSFTERKVQERKRRKRNFDSNDEH